ncbi:MAG: hypothetical protein JNG89_20025 [Planctomycetaceae bacterium]|nr:hypothetical protein [Planctomycetaceae bacterium]
MSQIAEWFAPSLLRTSLTLIVAALLVATCVKWLRLRSPAGEQWAWLLVLVQGVMFVSLTIPVPSEWLPQLRTAPTSVDGIDLPVESPVQQSRPRKLDVPERRFERRSRPIEVFAETGQSIRAV